MSRYTELLDKIMPLYGGDHRDLMEWASAIRASEREANTGLMAAALAAIESLDRVIESRGVVRHGAREARALLVAAVAKAVEA